MIGNTSQWPGPTISLPLLLRSRWSISTYISQASGLEDKILHLQQLTLVLTNVRIPLFSGMSSFVWLTHMRNAAQIQVWWQTRLPRLCTLESNKCPFNKGCNIYIVQRTNKQVWNSDRFWSRWQTTMQKDHSLVEPDLHTKSVWESGSARLKGSVSKPS